MILLAIVFAVVAVIVPFVAFAFIAYHVGKRTQQAVREAIKEHELAMNLAVDRFSASVDRQLAEVRRLIEQHERHAESRMLGGNEPS